MRYSFVACFDAFTYTYHYSTILYSFLLPADRDVVFFFRNIFILEDFFYH